jgi:GxxExxY protein
MIHEELSREIIGAAMVVLNELKPGLDEKLYERAMMIELKHRGQVNALVCRAESRHLWIHNC